MTENPHILSERLKVSNVEKFTFDGKKFQTLTVLSAKYLLRVLLTIVQFINMTSPSS